MSVPAGKTDAGERGFAYARGVIRRAFAEFLAVPTGIIIGFIVLAAISYVLDWAAVRWIEPLRGVLRIHVFGDAKSTGDLLGTIAGSIITVASITISLLLITVQQAAGTMTHQVLDQFLRRRQNQAYFGFFIGVAVYALVTLATVSPPFNPVLGASLAVLLTTTALILLILLLYTTLDQMRPVEIIEKIHDHILAARNRQLPLVRKTRRSPIALGPIRTPVRSARHGFATRIDVDAIGAATGPPGGMREVVLLVSIGSYVAFQDVVAEVTAPTPEEADVLAKVVSGAIHLERQRDIVTDPAYGIEQLETIAWTTISTSKSDPAPGLLTIQSLRDVLARWSAEEACSEPPPLAVVYTDNVLPRLMDAFETLAVVSSESMQHQNFIEVARTFSLMFDRLPSDLQRRAEDLILRILAALGEHVLTAELNTALTGLVATLKASSRSDTAAAVQRARDTLARSIGKLSSRSTRTEQ